MKIYKYKILLKYINYIENFKNEFYVMVNN